MEFQSLKYSESALPKDHFCEVEICKPVSDENIFQVIVLRRTGGSTDKRTGRWIDRQIDDRHRSITIAHPEHYMLG